MKISNNILRKTTAVLLVTSLIGGLAYIKYYVGGHKAPINTIEPEVTVMQAHIESLNSRIKHLSLDNKRLSATGHRLVDQLQLNNASIKNKLLQTKELQIELATLDQNIIRQYENYLLQQEVFVGLKNVCKKPDAKNKKCANYAQTKHNIEELSLQIKALKAKREVLLSQIARTYGVL